MEVKPGYQADGGRRSSLRTGRNSTCLLSSTTGTEERLLQGAARKVRAWDPNAQPWCDNVRLLGLERLTRLKHLEETIDPNSDLFLAIRDVLVQRSNTLDLVGTAAVFDGPSGVYVYPDLMMRMRFREDATGHWFWRYANSANGRRSSWQSPLVLRGVCRKSVATSCGGCWCPSPPCPDTTRHRDGIGGMWMRC